MTTIQHVYHFSHNMWNVSMWPQWPNYCFIAAWHCFLGLSKKWLGLFGEAEKISVNQRRYTIAKDLNNDAWKITTKQHIDEFSKYLFKKYGKTAVVYFEACGSENGSGAISGNIYKFTEYCGFIFDIKIGDRMI